MSDRHGSGGLPLLLLLVMLSAGGGAWLLSRTVVRDVKHPAYSTLSDTPQGCRLFFDALASAGRHPRRVFDTAPLPDGVTLFRIGTPLASRTLARLLQNPDEAAFVAGGGRLVCAFEGTKPGQDFGFSDASSPSCETGSCSRAEALLHGKAPNFAKGLRLTTLTNLTSQARAEAVTNGIAWHSVAVFDPTPEAAGRWQTRFALDGHPVMMEARYGKGSVVLATDCYFLSNEALAQERSPALLSALAGTAEAVLFDEASLGIREQHNTAWLMFRYRLHLFMAVIGALLLLTLWQQACPLLPRLNHESNQAQRGLCMEDGVVSLLRGHIARTSLPRELCRLWLQSEPRTTSEERREMERLLDHAEALRASPVETSRALHHIAQRHKPGASRSHHNSQPKNTHSGDRPCSN